jgi:hypothetical protein
MLRYSRRFPPSKWVFSPRVTEGNPTALSWLLTGLQITRPADARRLLKHKDVRLVDAAGLSIRKASAGDRLAPGFSLLVPHAKLTELLGWRDERDVPRLTQLLEKHEVERERNHPKAIMSRTTLASSVPFEVLWETNDFLAINKPRGLAVHGGRGTGEHECVDGMLRAQKLNLRLVHRLDKATTGYEYM